MRVLFLHQNFPGQFLHVAAHLQREGGHDLVAVVPEANTRPRMVPTRTYRFDPRSVSTTVPLARYQAEQTARGAAVAAELLTLKREGFTPDLIVGHGGWGETLFARDVWPDVRILLHAEFFYSAGEAEAGFDPEFAGMRHDLFPLQIRAQNANYSLALLDADQGVAPTEWQASRFPAALRSKITVAHEGINTDLVQPWPGAVVRLKQNGLVLRPGDEVVTFVSRNLEPHRGFHVFMRALPAILARRPHAQVVIVGGDDTSYGPPPRGGGCWREVMLAEVGKRIDQKRVHFVGYVSYTALVRLLQISAAHVYLTYPFVLSWSMLDAMSAGALVIGSRTQPVEEVISHYRNGLLVDFGDIDGLAEVVAGVLATPKRFSSLRRAARETMQARYDLRRVCLPVWLQLISDTIKKHLPKSNEELNVRLIHV
jgi:glycosyltransferase involved in cell wall biosynthesis